MIYRPIAVALICTFALAACQQTPADTAKDVTQARQSAAENNQDANTQANQDRAKAEEDVAAAQAAIAATDENAEKKLTAAESDARMVAVNAKYDVAMTEAKGRHEVANEKCGAETGIRKDACLSTSDAAFAAEAAAITADRDAELVAATDTK